MALILLTCRLHEIDREVGYLQAVLADWFTSVTPQAGDALTTATPAATRHLNLLQEELSQFYLPELQSSRITLLLSVVFVAIYICSWWWMAFAIKQVSQGGSVSLKTVLLLAVFAAVDIAASTGFVLLRLIMKNPEGPELANMVTNVTKIVAKFTANLVAKYDANLALAPRSRQVPIDVTSCCPFPSIFTKSLRQISSNREERCYTSNIFT
ncbi:uncharacterized protein TNCV_961231 [Trichonephila clavipes]|uniref:Uncharacterized protein n=1 Tax=Trichonephila clavipes TaxID=2585209 RepID=A0A8X6S9S5_TRICX|nr:uncharacterized protein TNCV_961231 [Trichonephila clavipes]